MNAERVLLDGEQLRSLVFLQQISHVFQTDAQCGCIVQQRGYCGWQYPRYAQGDQRQVEGHDKPVAAVDPIHQRFTELTQRQLKKQYLSYYVELCAVRTRQFRKLSPLKW